MDKIRAAEERGELGTKLTNRTLRKLTANKLAGFGVVLFAVICILCFGAPLFTQYSATAIDLRSKMAAPSAEHIMGTDQMGRDIWARMLYGGRISIIVGVGSALGGALIGVVLGLFVGYKGGWMDSILIKISDIFQSIPQMVIIIILVALVGQSMQNLIWIFVLTGWPGMYRMTRSKVLSLKEQELVQPLRAVGISDAKIAF